MLIRRSDWEGAQWPPRRWQREALDAAIDAIDRGVAAVTHAVMGAGKSALIAELAACVELGGAECVVVSTPTVALVEQLVATIGRRVGADQVGAYYTRAKQATRPIVVACNPSLGALAIDLAAAGLSVGLWIVDEAHNSESATLLAAADELRPSARHGLTATPYRADEERGLSLWSELSYSYGPAQALADGVVVPWDVRGWEGGRCSVDDACVEMIRSAVTEGLGPGVVDAGGGDAETRKPMLGIQDAEAFAARLVAEGIRAEAVHSRLDRSEIAARIERLRAGVDDVLVHVTLLKEGVDLPWLRWLCLRRRVGSRVHFAQHVGRALRAAPGKTRAVIFDPHDLFGVHQLSHAALLGGEATDTRPSESPTVVVLDFLAEAMAGSPEGVRVLAVGAHGEVRVRSELELYLRRLTIALDAAGVIDRSKSPVDVNGHWRGGRASAEQLAAIKRAAPSLARAKGVPGPVMEAIRYVYAYRDRLSKGAASDLLSCVYGLQRRAWTPIATELLDAGSVRAGRRITCPTHGLVDPRWARHRHGTGYADLLCPRCGHVFRSIRNGSTDLLRYPELEGSTGAVEDGLRAWSRPRAEGAP